MHDLLHDARAKDKVQRSDLSNPTARQARPIHAQRYAGTYSGNEKVSGDQLEWRCVMS